jgi:hypothetical protein
VARVRSQASACEIHGGHSGSVTSFFPSTSVFSCQWHSTNSPHSSSTTCFWYQKNKRAKSGNLPKNSSLPETGERWIENKFHLWVIEGNSSHFLCYASPALLSSLLKSVIPFCLFTKFRWLPDLGITAALGMWMGILLKISLCVPIHGLCKQLKYYARLYGGGEMTHCAVFL